MVRSRCRVVAIAFVLFSLATCLAPLHLVAQEPVTPENDSTSPPEDDTTPSPEDNTTPPPPPETRQEPVFKTHWLTILDANYFLRENVLNIQVRGATSLPDGAIVDLDILCQGHAADALYLCTRVMGGKFEIMITITRKVSPNYYILKASCRADRQEGDLRREMGSTPEVSGIFPLVFGTAEEIETTREQTLAKYQETVEFVESSFALMKQAYLELIELKDPIRAQENWDYRFVKLPGEIIERRTALENLKQRYLLPPLPLVHTFVIEGLNRLAMNFDMLRNALTTEITAEMRQKGDTELSFLENAERDIQAYLRTMRTQFMMERNAALRDLLVHQVSRLFWLLGNSRDVFDALKTAPEDERDYWRSVRAKWDKELTELEEGMEPHKKSDLPREYPELSRALQQAPDALRKFWRSCDSVILDRIPLVKRENQILQDYFEAFSRIVPAMEVLGITREIYDDGMRRIGSADGEITVPRYGPVLLDEYLARKVAKMDTPNHQARLGALQTLISFGPRIKPMLEERLNKPAENTPVLLAMCRIALAYIGDERGQTLLPGILQNAENDESLRMIAAEAMGALKNDEYLPVLARGMLNDQSELVRGKCATALGATGKPAAVVFLLDGLADNSTHVRTLSKLAIETLVGRDIEFNPEASAEERSRQIEALREALGPK